MPAPKGNELARVLKATEAVYKQAAEELKKKLADFQASFAKKDAEKRAALAAGEITKQEYRSWLSMQVFQGKQWEAKAAEAAKTLVHANEEAAAIVNDGCMTAYAAAMNFGTYELEKATALKTGFTLYNRESVSRLLAKDPQLLPYWKIDEEKDYVWSYQKVQNALLEGILQGKKIPDIQEDFIGKLLTKELPEKVQKQMENRMRLFARTGMTGAHNAGRIDALHRAEEKGIKVKKKWLATQDNRTRDAHADIDGQIQDIDDPFESELGPIMYPGDPSADPANVYNCRCTLVYVYPELEETPEGTEDAPEYEQMTFDQWIEAKENQEAVQGETKPTEVTAEDLREKGPELPARPITQGTDISDTWTRRKDEFTTEIEDVINAQGFDGNPRIVGREEFDQAVKDSGFVAQRTYSAPDKETLDAYRDQLYNGGPGNWYVDCGTGGAQYGQGMYCAADYNGELTDGIKSEMEHYRELGESRFRTAQSDYAEAVYQAEMAKVETPLDEKYRDALTDEIGVTSLGTKSGSEEREYVREWMKDNPSEAQRLRNEYKEAQRIGAEKGMEIEKLTKDEFREKYPDNAPQSYTETMTLTPDAKVITYEDAVKLADKYHERHSYEGAKESARSAIFDEIGLKGKERKDAQSLLTLYDKPITAKTKEQIATLESRLGMGKDGRPTTSEMYRQISARVTTERKSVMSDVGSIAAAHGYDAINAVEHGESGSYTVILNRTKCIILDGRKK